MNTRNLFRIAKKDWVEVRSNKELMIPLLILPALLSIVLPLIFAITLPLDPGSLDSIAVLRASFGPAYDDVSPGGLMIISMANSMLKPYLLIIPTMVAMIIASDSIAGEKERKTIESFLVLPLSDREIIVGKVLGALIPSLLLSWISFFIMGFTLNFAGRGNFGSHIIIFEDASWWLLNALLVTILSFISVLFMVLISSTVKTAKAAQQYAAVGVIPIVGLVISGLSGVFVLGVSGILLVSLVLGCIAVLLTYLATKHLNREKLILALD
ncbi:MAG: putative ABC transporter permease [Promethearchaeota archaeon CR_4]|nr:MAG: putative ABC transporter permease [Candidatus Lokiarchaeota archaeon CR_4]